MHDDRTVTITLDPTELDHFRGIVRDELVLWCTHIHDLDESGTLDEDGELADRLDTLATFSRLAACLERGAISFTIAVDEIPRFRAVLCDLLFVEQDQLSYEGREDGGSVLAVVEGEGRVALILDSLAPQIGGLF